MTCCINKCRVLHYNSILNPHDGGGAILSKWLADAYSRKNYNDEYVAHFTSLFKMLHLLMGRCHAQSALSWCSAWHGAMFDIIPKESSPVVARIMDALARG